MADNQEAYDALTNAGAEPNAEMEAWMQEFLGSLERSGYDERPPRAKGRLVQTFKFLKELAELRNPVQRDLDGCSQVLRLDSWPVHPCITVRRGDPTEEDDQDSAGKELEPIVRVERAKLTPCPKPPQLLKGWLKPGWEAVKAEVDVLQTRNFRDGEEELSRWGSAKMMRGLLPSTIGRLLARDGLKLSFRLCRHANSSRRSTRYGRRCSAKAIVWNLS